MTTVTTFDRDTLKTLRADVDQALAAVAKAYGIKLSMGAIRFGANEFTTKLTGATKSATVDTPAGVNPTWVKSFKSHCVFFGLKATDLGKTVNIDGKEYVIVGARPKANLPIVVQRKTGGAVAVSAQSVVRALA